MSSDRPREAARQHVDQGTLLEAAEVQQPTGNAAAAVAGSITSAQLDPLDHGMAALALQLARAVDVALHRHDAYAVAAAGRELRETLTRLKLDPTAREGAAGDELKELLDRMGTPT